jgi:hypothetical protein
MAIIVSCHLSHDLSIIKQYTLIAYTHLNIASPKRYQLFWACFDAIQMLADEKTKASYFNLTSFHG